MAGSQAAVDAAVERGAAVVAEDAFTICRCPHIDVIVDVTAPSSSGPASSSTRSRTASPWSS